MLNITDADPGVSKDRKNCEASKNTTSTIQPKLNQVKNQYIRIHSKMTKYEEKIILWKSVGGWWRSIFVSVRIEE